MIKGGSTITDHIKIYMMYKIKVKVKNERMDKMEM